MLAVAISVFVFAGMGVLLNRAFSLWMEGAARWKLAQHTRIARERILRGGFNNPSEGLLRATDISIVEINNALNVAYATETDFYGICAYTNIFSPRMYLVDQNTISPYWSGGYNRWRWAVRNANNMPIPDTEVTHMTAEHTTPVVSLTYRMRYSALGRTFTQPCTIRAHLINEND